MLYRLYAYAVCAVVLVLCCGYCIASSLPEVPHSVASFAFGATLPTRRMLRDCRAGGWSALGRRK
jgi:hypothetical protein